MRSTQLKLLSVVVAASSIVAGVVVTGVGSTPAFADTAPPAGTPATVSADALPTIQINGIVWAQAIVGNTVYATGRFTQARPAGVAVGGAGSVTRTNLVAYDITTGNMTSFNHSLTGTNAEGRAIAASPDGKRLYVGGSFSAADGQPRANFAVFDISTAAGSFVGGFAAGPTGTVRAVAATNTQVFVGGAFSQAGGQTRNRLAAYNSTGSLVSGWAPSVTTTGIGGAYVSALALAPAQGNLIIGGYFNQINGATYYSTGAVKISTGAPVTPWASQSASYPIRDQLKPGAPAGRGVGITSLAADATQVYLTSYHFAGVYGDGAFEGRAAINPANGNIIWVNDCHGDSYSAFPVGQVLYSVSHNHDCSAIGGFPDGASYRAEAETTYATGVNGPTPFPERGYTNYQGVPRGTQLNWYPTLSTANVSGSSQAAWSVVGNANYVALGGEFPTAQGVAQQGLVRYAVKALAPNKRGPKAYSTYGVVPLTNANPSGQATITFKTTSDQDNGLLTYRLYRNGGTTAIYTKTVDTRFWNTPTQTFTDTGLAPGSYNRYRMVVSDPLGNTTTTYSLYDDNNPAIAYSGTWINEQNRGYGDYGNGIHYTSQNGAKATFTFTGTQISLVTEKNADRGNISVSVDGAAATTVNVYNATFVPQQTVYQKTGMTNAAHTITVTKLSGTWMDIDGFLVRP